MKCPKCFKGNLEGVKICSRCGYYFRYIDRMKIFLYKLVAISASLVTIIVFPLIVHSYSSSANQTKLLKSQISVLNKTLIFQMADRCLWTNYDGGDRVSFFTLTDLSRLLDKDDDNMKKVSELKIKQIEGRYKLSEQFVMQAGIICKKHVDCFGDGGREEAGDFDLKNVLEHLATSNYPMSLSRAQAVYLLGQNENYTKSLLKLPENQNIEFTDILGAIVGRLKEDEPSLLVSKTALDSFENLFKEYKRQGIFDFSGAINAWEVFLKKKK